MVVFIIIQLCYCDWSLCIIIITDLLLILILSSLYKIHSICLDLHSQMSFSSLGSSGIFESELCFYHV